MWRPDLELKKIVDDMLIPLHSASLGRFPTGRLMRQVKPKLASANCGTNPLADVADPDDEYIQLDTCDAVRMIVSSALAPKVMTLRASQDCWAQASVDS